MNEVWVYIIGLLPSLITGCILFYVQRSQKKRDEKEDGRARARRTETKLLLDLQMATAKLAYAVAMALKRGTPNGEVEEGVKAYEEAVEEFREFEREQISRL